MSVTEALEALSTMAQAAQSSGVVPIGPYAIALAVVVAGSQAALHSGLLTPNAPVEIDDIGLSFDLAIVRMRVALEEGKA